MIVIKEYWTVFFTAVVFTSIYYFVPFTVLSIFNILNNQEKNSKGHTSGTFSSYCFTGYKYLCKNIKNVKLTNTIFLL